MAYPILSSVGAGVALVIFALVARAAARRVDAPGAFPTFFTVTLGQILIAGYLLSAIDQLANGVAWLGVGLLLGVMASAALLRLPVRRSSPTSPLGRVVSPEAVVLGGVFATLALMQLGIILAAAPHNLDSMTYRMARVGYYLQHGNIATFESNFWAQLMHLKNSALVVTFLTLVTRGWSNSAQLLQFLSWFVLVFCNFGVAVRLGVSRRAALVAALASGLIIEVLMQATTTQDDLFITAMGACFLYFGIGAINGRSRVEAALTAAAIGIAVGSKISALPFMFAIACLLTMLTFHSRGGETWSAWARRLVMVGAMSVTGCLVFGLPAGYWENQQVYGSPLGHPYAIAAKSLGDEGLSARFRYGVINSARYGLDFLDASGVPEAPVNVNMVEQARTAYTGLWNAAGVDLRDAPTLAPPYSASGATFRAHEDRSYWGLWGPFWFLPLGVCALFFSRARAVAWMLLGGGGVFWASQTFTGIYDPWRGRYFIQLIVFVAPMAAIGWERVDTKAWARLPFFAMAIVCSYISFNSVLTRHNSPWPEVLHMDWVAQVTRNTPELERTFRTIEKTIPADAGIIVILEEAYSEFPLFGPRLTRKLYPAPTLERLQKLTSERHADYIVFNRLLERNADDCSLGAGIFLRRLGDARLNPCIVTQSPRVKDLAAIKEALNKYYAVNRAYPFSQGWDGFQSRWGSSEADWINALTPDYIETLPVAVRMTEDDWAMYLYRSDGQDYKVIVVAASDAADVIASYPDMDDAASSSGVYGVWSDGAKDWKFE